jgi:hypothetical protein
VDCIIATIWLPEPVCLPMFNEDEQNRPERCGRHWVRCFVLFSLCSAVTGQLLGKGKQSVKCALNSGPESILPGWNFGEGQQVPPTSCPHFEETRVRVTASSALDQFCASNGKIG